MKQFTIGKLAAEASVGVETIRFYERKGLIKKPSTKSGFRKYPEEDIQRIRFIKRAQELGFTLKEVQELLQLNTNPKATCGDIQALTELKLKEVEAKINDLKKMKASLKKLDSACSNSKEAVACCRITDCFEGKC
ncbi:DNA-binding transcriptional activator of copper-responsive regulon genes [Bdellovibrio bacteriovorus W]|nr:DNA-binding transcriptional activator of copper-responsive regulon genes [Bdellovibrio bacteriovorus W]